MIATGVSLRRHRGRFAGLAIALLALAGPAAASAAISATPDNTFVTNGEVFAVARTADKIYLGGEFDTVGPATGQWVAISASTGKFDPAMPQVSGLVSNVDAVVPDGTGGFFIGGEFSKVGGVPHKNLAHIRSDKSVDPAWNPSTNNRVRALALSGSTLYIGGDFNGATSINGSVPRNFAAALDTTTGTPTGWDPNATNRVNALAVSESGSTVYLGGEFNGTNSINTNKNRNRLAAVDATTGLDTGWDPNANGPVYALAVSGPTVYVGGFFNGANSIGGMARNRVAAVDTAGNVTSWDPKANGAVNALALSGSTVYIGGDFNGSNSINNNKTRNRLAAVNDTNGDATTWDPGANNSVRTLAVSGGTVYAGGDFSGPNSINGALTRNRLAAIDATTGGATDWDPSAGSRVNALAVSGDVVAAGGFFGSVNGELRRNAAALNAADGTLSSWNPNVEDSVRALAVSGSTVYIGGDFAGAQSINGNQPRNRLAAVDATTGVASSWNPNLGNTVRALAVSGSTVYIGGEFSGMNALNGSVLRNHAAAVDATTGLDTGWNPNVSGPVNALAISGSTIYLGGDFNGATSINGSKPRNGAAAVDATVGLDTGWNPNIDGAVLALAVSGSTVYMGGDLFGINGSMPRNYAAAADATTGVATGWDPNLSDRVNAVAVSGSSIYIGGRFNGNNSINGTMVRNSLAAVDPTTGTVTAWDPNMQDSVDALAPDGGGGVIASGSFTAVGVRPREGIASFSEPPANTAVPEITGTQAVGEALSCSQGAWAGTMPQSYAFQWLRDGVAIAGATSAGYTVTADDDGHVLTCRVTAANLGGSANATSAAATLPVPPPPPPPPVVVPDRPRLRKAGSPSARKRGKTFLVRTGFTAVCPVGNPTCTFRLTASAVVPVVVAALTTRITIGRANVSVPAGKTRKLTFKLNKLGATTLRKRKRLSVRLSFAIRAGTAAPVTAKRTIRIRAPRKRR